MNGVNALEDIFLGLPAVDGRSHHCLYPANLELKPCSSVTSHKSHSSILKTFFNTSTVSGVSYFMSGAGNGIPAPR
jgi:hypothetical protein